MGSTWLSTVKVSSYSHRLIRQQFAVVCRLKMGVLSFREPISCRYCESDIDVLGLYNCKGKGDIIRRHNLIVNLVYNLANSADVFVCKEVEAALDDHSRQADLEIHLDQGYATDVSVVNPTTKGV